MTNPPFVREIRLPPPRSPSPVLRAAIIAMVAFGVRVVEGKVQLGLTTKEISTLKDRIADLLADVDTGKIKVTNAAGAAVDSCIWTARTRQP